MRCKPGDLAVIVSAGRANTPQDIGVFVDVLDRFIWLHGQAYWRCQPRGEITLNSGLRRSTKAFIADDILQPIRPAPEKQTRDEEITA
jgi:hypothetical protein